MTDEELFAEFFRRVADRAREELGITVYRATDPLAIIWAAGHAFSFNPAEARRQGLDIWVDRVVTRLRVWQEEEA